MNPNLPFSLGTVIAAGASAPPFSAIAADGWQSTIASPTDLSLEAFTVNRAGFSAAGSATTISDTLYVTKRVREPYPDEADFTANSVALTEYVYADDVTPGATNNSTEDSPKPICRWAMPSRLVVGSSIHWEIVAFHTNARLGKPVACVQVRATNGTNSTAWQTVSTMTVSTAIDDARDTAVYQGDLDTSSLPDGLYYLEAKVYPHFGVAASVAESTSSTDLRAFGRRYFTKNATLASTPPYVYVASTGDDATAVVSTTAATAAASPALTVQGAIRAASAQIADGLVDGLIVRVVDTVGFGTTQAGASPRNQVSGTVIVTRAPGTARAAAIVQQANAINMRFATGGTLDAALANSSLTFYDVSYARTASGQLGNGATPTLHVQLWNVNFDNGSIVGAWSGGTGQIIEHYGAVWTNIATNTFGYSTSQTQYTLRGVTATAAGGYEGGCVIGCSLTNFSSPTYADAQNGAVWYNSAFLSPSSTNAPINITTANAGETITGVALVQCFIEPTHTTATTPGVRPCSDSALGNCTHAVIHHNVNLGAGTLSRWNLFYDDATVARFYKFVSIKGNICPQINVKGDVFKTDGTRLGNRAIIHGVGCLGNFTKYRVNSPATEEQFYSGRNSDIGTSTTVLNDPLFVDDRGTTFDGTTYTAGAGGSDVHLDTGSPCIGIVSELLLPFDYAGAARTGTQDAGLYAP
jgi:hypothetical protein